MMTRSAASFVRAYQVRLAAAALIILFAGAATSAALKAWLEATETMWAGQLAALKTHLNKNKR